MKMTSKQWAVLAAAWAILRAVPAGAGTVEHALSNGGTLTADQADEVITDRAALDEISTTSQGEPDPTLEAYWGSPEFEVYFNHEAIGYVQMDDWDELDVDDLWDSYVEGAKEQTRLFGYEVKPLRWVIEPTLDREKAVAYYALEVQFGEEAPLINMIVFDFGRYGYEQMTLVQESSAFPAAGAGGVATRVADAYAFGPEADYGDFREGDVVAAVGAGGLIAAALGVKFGKGILALALIFAKKFWFLLLLLIPAAIWKFLTGRSKKAEA
jgi:uncharacterized membrane-anchored protein